MKPRFEHFTSLGSKIPLEADDYHYKCAKKGRALMTLPLPSFNYR
jgi:hypothetical protein